MPVPKRPSGSSAITDKGAPTPKDDKFAGQEARLRRLLLNSAEVQGRFAALHGTRPTGHVSTWDPQRGLAYWNGVGVLREDLDDTWSDAEIDGIAERWPT